MTASVELVSRKPLRRCLPFVFLHAGCVGVIWVGWSGTAQRTRADVA